jgi:pimeloyl-ACP methyl ester carboxylesterase
MVLMQRLAKKIFFGRFQKKWRWPEGMPEEGWERVTFRNESGARIAAVFGTSHGEQAFGAVVLAHPMTVAAKAFWLKHGHAELLRSRGFHVLAFDFNGFGESESTDFNYPGDVAAAAEYLHARFPELGIAVLGSSFGAGYAICAMARKGHLFRAAVLEGPFPSLPFFWRPYPIPRLLLRASQLVYPRLERELRPILKATQVEENPDILLIFGENDTVSPVHIGEEFQSAFSQRTPAELWTVPGAEHTFAFRAHRDVYAERVTEFLHRAFASRNASRAT